MTHRAFKTRPATDAEILHHYRHHKASFAHRAVEYYYPRSKEGGGGCGNPYLMSATGASCTGSRRRGTSLKAAAGS